MTDRFSEITRWFDEMLHERLRPICPYCGAKLDHYWYYGYHGGQYQTCKKCGKLVKKND